MQTGAHLSGCYQSGRMTMLLPQFMDGLPSWIEAHACQQACNIGEMDQLGSLSAGLQHGSLFTLEHSILHSGQAGTCALEC